VKGLTEMPEVGSVYEGTVKSIKDFGAFVEFLPKKEGLLHISEISWKRLDTMEGVLNDGDKVKVKLIGLDPKTGKFKLSRKALMPKPEGYVERPERPERSQGDRPQRRDGDRQGGGDRPQRPQGERPKFEKPKREEGDQPTQQQQPESNGE
jgi:polyribonucleotide nucleotidyltransferase